MAEGHRPHPSEASRRGEGGAGGGARREKRIPRPKPGEWYSRPHVRGLRLSRQAVPGAFRGSRSRPRALVRPVTSLAAFAGHGVRCRVLLRRPSLGRARSPLLGSLPVSGGSESCAASAPAKVLLSIAPAKARSVLDGATRRAVANHCSRSPPARAVMQFLRPPRTFVPPCGVRTPTVCLSRCASPTRSLSPACAHLRRCHPSQEPSAVPELDHGYCVRLAVGSACRRGLSASPRRAFPG